MPDERYPMATMRCIHYGCSKFEISRFKEPHFRNEGRDILDGLPFCKPLGGLWASPIDSKYSWKRWCEGEDFRLEDLEKSFTFTFTGTLYTIDRDSTARRILRLVLDKEVDAIFYPEHMLAFRLEDAFYGWDCESIVVLSPETITPD